MTKIKKIISKNLIYFFVFFIYIISVYIKKPLPQKQNFLNSDATYHTLLTVKALIDNPIKIHHFLPIVTLSRPQDKYISWGATLPDKYGNYYYTSFMPLQFFIPYIWFKFTNFPINEISLYLFSTILGFICLILSTIFFIRIFKKELPKYFIILSVSFFYIFSPELLHSHGLIYWGQSLYQLVFLLQLIYFFNLLDKPKKLLYVIFFVLCLLCPLTEWTGYISNLGFLTVIIFNKLKKNNFSSIKPNLLILGITTATVLSIIIFISHFLSVLRPIDFYNTVSNRFISRSIASKISFLFLIKGYFTSFRIFIVLPILFSLISIILIKTSKLKIKYIYTVVFALLSIPLIENLILKEHAIIYTYDRSKGVFVLIFLFLVSITIFNKKYKNIIFKITPILLLLLFVISIRYLCLYSFTDNDYRWNDPQLGENTIMAKYIDKYYNNNSIFAQDCSVRGYTNLLFNRSIVEWVTLDRATLNAKQNNLRYIIYFQPLRRPWQKDIYNAATIVDTYNNKKQELKVENGEVIEDNWIEILSEFKAANITDSMWDHGISNKEPIILFDNINSNRENLINAKQLRTKDNNFIVQSIDYDDLWVRVKIIDKNNYKGMLAYPNKIEIIK